MQDKEANAKVAHLQQTLSEIDNTNHPHRQFRHPAKASITEEKRNVRTTLLEYGR